MNIRGPGRQVNLQLPVRNAVNMPPRAAVNLPPRGAVNMPPRGAVNHASPRRREHASPGRREHASSRRREQASSRRRESASPGRRESASPRRHEHASSRRREPAESGERPPTASGAPRQSRSSSGERHGHYNDTTARQLIVENRSQSLLVIGDSNVRRLQASNNCPGTKFHSISGATTEHVAQDLGHAIDMCGAAQVVLHVGTNDIARKGSEGIAKSILGLAQQAKDHAGVRQVYICSVTPRKDLGSFVFSRSESVNNRLRSLCNKTDRVGFIDVRQKLDRCQFGGLVRDAIHYNRPGAAQALKLIKDSAKDFLV